MHFKILKKKFEKSFGDYDIFILSLVGGWVCSNTKSCIEQ
jgi:hypothetical protein